MCRQKLSLTNQSLKENLDQLDQANVTNTNEELEKALGSLDQIRGRMIDKINEHFNKLKVELNNGFRQSTV